MTLPPRFLNQLSKGDMEPDDFISAMQARGDGQMRVVREFYRPIRMRLVRYGRSKGLTISSRDLEDLTQEVFVAILKSWPNYKGKGPVLAWVAGIARHKCMHWIDEAVRDNGAVTYGYDADDGCAAVIDDAVGNCVRLALKEFRLKAKPSMALLVDASMLDGMSLEELAKIVRCENSAISERKSYAYQKLKPLLMKYCADELIGRPRYVR